MAGIRVITGAEVEAVSNESPQTLISRSSPLQYKLNVKILSNEEGASANAAVATIRAAKLIITAPPAAMERIHGDIMERIRAQPQFRASIPVKVFKSAAVYPHAWWEPALDPEKTYMTDSTCLGSITPYRGRGPNGEAVLHTSYAEGECADNYWASATNEIPDPIQVIYHLWDDGGWHLWALDSPSKISLQNWATSGPLTEEEVYLANEAWGIKRGWVQASLGAADEVLRHIFRERETQVGHMKVAKGHEKSVDVEKTSKEGEPVFAIQRAGGGVETEWTTRVDDEGSRSDISRDGVMWSEQKLESIALLPNLF
ncbi:hypothetical protein HK102_005702 [Quaeritorhiza haematococci]|nr:hypothetical protein HK102_005702 [Quaeritorhiza haematococci]